MNNTLNSVPVLDHGFVTLRNLAGPTRRPWNRLAAQAEDGADCAFRAFDADDTDVPNAARMSFDAADLERTYEVEMKLARFLAVNKHATPFEAIEVWLEMKLPIFVARQFVRHRTVSLNEVSARYVKLPEEWYVPAIQDVVLQSKDKKQGGKLIDLENEDEVARGVRHQTRLDMDCQRSYQCYLESIADGIAMEQARCHLHVNHYTHWLWKQDLRNLFHFLALRDHSHAQREAQVYAQAITGLLEPHIPGLVALYKEVMK